MILEVADIRIQPGQEAAFESAARRGVTEVIAQAAGFIDWQLVRGVESPQRYLLQIRWATLEDHTEGFRGSALFGQWRALVGPFFAAPPQVEHFGFSAP